mgnify:CR=1 FL=1
MTLDSVSPTEHVLLNELSASLAQLTALSLRQSLCDLHIQSFTYQDAMRIPALISNRAKKICSVQIYHVITEDDAIEYGKKIKETESDEEDSALH